MVTDHTFVFVFYETFPNLKYILKMLIWSEFGDKNNTTLKGLSTKWASLSILVNFGMENMIQASKSQIPPAPRT